MRSKWKHTPSDQVSLFVSPLPPPLPVPPISCLLKHGDSSDSALLRGHPPPFALFHLLLFVGLPTVRWFRHPPVLQAMTDQDAKGGAARKTSGAAASDREARWVVVGGGDGGGGTQLAGRDHGAYLYTAVGCGGGGGGAGGGWAPQAGGERYLLVPTSTGNRDVALRFRNERYAFPGVTGNRELARGGGPYGAAGTLGNWERRSDGCGPPGTVGGGYSGGGGGDPRGQPRPLPEREQMELPGRESSSMQLHPGSYFSSSYMWEVHLGTYRDLSRH